MELKEAHRLADRYRLATFCLSDSESATVILDDRITELEAEMKQILSEFDEVETQRDEVVKALIRIKCELLPYKTNPTADHTGPIDHIIATCGRLTEIKQPGVAG